VAKIRAADSTIEPMRRAEPYAKMLAAKREPLKKENKARFVNNKVEAELVKRKRTGDLAQWRRIHDLANSDGVLIDDVSHLANTMLSLVTVALGTRKLSTTGKECKIAALLAKLDIPWGGGGEDIVPPSAKKQRQRNAKPLIFEQSDDSFGSDD
jgi:hypothetical protein